MMSCTCRATPLKIFVQGLSQVHRLEASPSLVGLPIRTRPALPQNNFAFARQARSLHFSKNLSQDVSGAEAAKEIEVVDNNPSKDPDETPEVREEQPTATVEAPDTWKAIPSTSEKAPKRREDRLERKARTAYNHGENNFYPSGTSGAFDTTAETKKPRIKGPSSNQPQPGAAYWKAQKAALREKFPEGWRPRKRLSPDALAGIRALNAQFPDVYTTEALAEKFEVTPEAIRRILKSKWQPNALEEESRQERWFRRGKDVWESRAALGIKPPQKWRREGIVRDPSYHDWKKDAVQRNKTLAEKDDLEIKRGYSARAKRTSVPDGAYTPRVTHQRKGTYIPRSKGTYTPRSGGGDA